MDEFSYLSVLLSIILGLAITQILQGFRGLLCAFSASTPPCYSTAYDEGPK